MQLDLLTKDLVWKSPAFASRDLPGRQEQIQDCVNQILVKVSGPAPA